MKGKDTQTKGNHLQDQTAKNLQEKAKWISSSEETDKILRFQKPFHVKKGLQSASLLACGLGFYDFELNGKRVEQGYYKPDFSDYMRRNDGALTEKANEEYYAYYHTYEISSQIKYGENTLTVEVAPGYFNNTDVKDISYWHFGRHRLKFVIALYYNSGTEYVLSDENCRLAVTKSASTLYLGDRIDFTEKDYAYTSASVINEEINLIPSTSYGDTVGEIFYPKLIKTDGNRQIYDFGQNHTGGIKCTVVGERGTEVTVRYAEVKGNDGELNFKTSSFDGETPQTGKYVLSGKEDEISPKFCWYCYRYIEINSTKPIKVKNLQSLFIHADLQKNGEFSCSEQIFNDVYTKYLYTQLCNMHAGVPTDCPHREKKPYTGDGHLTVRSVTYSYDAERFYAKWLKDIIDSQEKDGYIPHTAPRMGCGGGFYWGYAIIEVPRVLYQLTGNKAYIEKSYNAVKKWVECFSDMHCGDYLPKNNGRQWCLSDWLSPEEVRVDTRYFNSVVYFLSVKGLNAFHEILYGKPSEEMTELAERIRKAINDEYFDREHYRYAKGEQGETAFALWAGIPDKEYGCGLKESLRRYYTEVTNGHFDTGIVLTPILLEYLTDNGMKDLALRLMTQTDYPSFAYLLEGETTIAEHWSKKWISYKFSEDSDFTVEGGGDLSHCHPMLGSVVSWLFERVAGLDLRNAYKKEIRIKPQFTKEISSAKALKRLSTGEAIVEYNTESGLYLRVRIPQGFKGILELDGIDGKFELLNNGNVKAVEAKAGLSLELACGEWELKAEG